MWRKEKPSNVEILQYSTVYRLFINCFVLVIFREVCCDVPWSEVVPKNDGYMQDG